MVTKQEIEAARTQNGGWTREQLASWGIRWPPPAGWKDRLLTLTPQRAAQLYGLALVGVLDTAPVPADDTGRRGGAGP